mmetsp:Transcript_14184/g.42281  ORF Transcript_14184/g.42281 Transcript_14184/m.42281 type:complete len:356 (+) Transcript_14184:142-1209(+)
MVRPLLASLIVCAAAYTALPKRRAAQRALPARYALMERPAVLPSAPSARAAPRNSTMWSVAEEVAKLGNEDEVIDLRPIENQKKGPTEFELNLGEAIDALRKDVPEFADREMDWSIYSPNIQLADPTGVQTKGLSSYKQFFGMIRLFRRVMIQNVDITYRLRYDWAGKKIVITWYSSWTAKGSRKAAHVDAVSYFHLDDDGKVFKHEVDRVEVNGRPMNPPYSVGWLAFREYVLAGLDTPAAVPSFFEPSFASATVQMAEALEAEEQRMESAGENAAEDKPKKQERKPKAKLLPGSCENMWDCESPMECCDFVMFKMCCRGGVGIPAFQPQAIPIPIPVPVDPFPGAGRPPPRSW